MSNWFRQKWSLGDKIKYASKKFYKTFYSNYSILFYSNIPFCF